MWLSKMSVSEGIPEEEIDKMLEEDLPENFKGAPKPKEKPYITRQKIVLEGKIFFSLHPLLTNCCNKPKCDKMLGVPYSHYF